MRTMISLGIILTLLIGNSGAALAQTSPQPNSAKDLERIEKVKKDINDIGVGKTITVSRIDNRDFFGRVKSIGNDDFEITDSDSKQVHIFKYVDIKNVRPGDGKIMSSGRRRNSRSAKYVVAGIVGGIIAFAVIAAKSLK